MRYEKTINGQKKVGDSADRKKAHASIGISTWETAILFDTKKETYLIPIKAEIRK